MSVGDSAMITITNMEEIRQKIERLKARISEGIVDGMKEYAPHGEQMIQDYAQKVVYDVYTPDENNPKAYKRTYKLKRNSRSFVDGQTLYIGTSSEGMENANGKPYLYRVLEGHARNPYEHPRPNKSGDFRPERDWITPTTKEFIEDCKQDGVLHRAIVRNVNSKLGR